MKDFLESEGYILNLLDISDNKKVIKNINKCDYFEDISIGEKYKLNIFYTKLFQHVWEELVRDALKESKEFRKSMEPLFFRKETRDKWFPNKISANDFITKNNIKVYKFEEQTTGLRVIYDIDIKSIPDLFSDYNGKKFIGDAKYYNDPENSHFDKELRIYNQLTNNEYPMVVFVPLDRTRVIHVRREELLELVIFNISVKDAISDAVNNTNEVIKKVHMFLYDKGYTRRI